MQDSVFLMGLLNGGENPFGFLLKHSRQSIPHKGDLLAGNARFWTMKNPAGVDGKRRV
ncbi:MAG: hypothetical protein ACOX8S_09400 [Christensenellales bacterium]|jgi:hypothetical protein